METYNTIQEIRHANRAINHKWFDASSMAFFNSEVLDKVYKGRYFISSERFDKKSPKLYTVRVCICGAIETVGKFQQFETVGAALAFIQTLPTYLPEAIEAAKTAFNEGKMNDFIGHATLEQRNNKEGAFSVDSFCGACAWLFENHEEIDNYACRAYFKEYKEALAE